MIFIFHIYFLFYMYLYRVIGQQLYENGVMSII